MCFRHRPLAALMDPITPSASAICGRTAWTYAAAMRFPDDKPFHLRMAALLIGALFLEQLAKRHLPQWTAPDVGIITFVLGLIWVALTAFHHNKASQQRLAVLESRLERLQQLTDALADDQRARRSLPKL
jgi:hypothetical protein